MAGGASIVDPAALQPASPPQKHGVPALISFFLPGVGQIIKGQILRGIGIIAAMIVSFLLIFVGIGLITTPILWIWNIYDAYNAN